MVQRGSVLRSDAVICVRWRYFQSPQMEYAKQSCTVWIFSIGNREGPVQVCIAPDQPATSANTLKDFQNDRYCVIHHLSCYFKANELRCVQVQTVPLLPPNPWTLIILNSNYMNLSSLTRLSLNLSSAVWLWQNWNLEILPVLHIKFSLLVLLNQPVHTVV